MNSQSYDLYIHCICLFIFIIDIWYCIRVIHVLSGMIFFKCLQDSRIMTGKVVYSLFFPGCLIDFYLNNLAWLDRQREKGDWLGNTTTNYLQDIYLQFTIKTNAHNPPLQYFIQYCSLYWIFAVMTWGTQHTHTLPSWESLLICLLLTTSSTTFPSFPHSLLWTCHGHSPPPRLLPWLSIYCFCFSEPASSPPSSTGNADVEKTFSAPPLHFGGRLSI